MREPFTTTEITTAIQSLKNNKTPGIDGLKAEQLKHSPLRKICLNTEIY